MENLMLEPLKFYDNTAKSLHETNAKEYFEDLVKKSGVDIEQNKKTVASYKKQLSVVEGLNKKISKYKFLKGFFIFLIVAGFLTALIGGVSASGIGQILCIVLGLAVGISLIFVIAKKINKLIKHFEEVHLKEKAKADNLLSQAQSQMAPLNALFTERDTFNLIEKTIPEIKFNDNYDSIIANDFIDNYNFIDQLDHNKSAINTVSGRLYQNPFVFCRYINHYMGTRDYHGSLVIHWTTMERDSNGRLRSVHHTQTLHATVVKPYPMYSYHTALSYGHQSAPDLNFTRDYEHVEDLSERQIEKKIKRGEKKLQEKARDALENGGNFTEMTNSEFDVLFDATDRDNEVQFRLMFSPLAQNNMVDLLRYEQGYGDDFIFMKRGKYNYIKSEHAQKWNMDAHPSNYYSYDFEQIKSNFINFNNEYFKSVYFDFAPLLAIPSYQAEPSLIFEPLQKDGSNYSAYEHEILANVIGSDKFRPKGSVTDVILKATYMCSYKETDCVMINAKSYVGHRRIDYIPTLGGDGRVHPVPVPWVEYLPVESNTKIAVKSLGLNRKDFVNKAKEKGIENSLYDTPSAYFHGLFAKIVSTTEVQGIDEILNRIKKQK